MGAAEWEANLALYDEPHGDEYFIIDCSVSPPVWYRLDGTVFEATGEAPCRTAHEVVVAAIGRGWTPERLYARPAEHLVAVYAEAAHTG